MGGIDPKQVKELLIKNWMTHDAMWLMHCAMELGMERTNSLNLRAVNSMAIIEAKRVAKLLGLEKIDGFDALRHFLEGAGDLLVADFMDFNYEFPERDVIRARMNNCFAYEGTKRLGVIDQYQCGIFERINGWLEGLKLDYTVEPEVIGCMMHQQGECFREYKILGYPS
jgi:hypothetical protein